LRADGSKNLGTFNIEMPIKTAQCLWGVDLSKAAKAVVSTVYPELDKQEIITTSAMVEGDFYKISASGFHFSSPTIKVKVTQENRATSVNSGKEKETQASKAVNNVGKNQRIICAKGKLRKVVVARNPSCPRGYQKMK
jgi:nickel-dependent lactate racemase